MNDRRQEDHGEWEIPIVSSVPGCPDSEFSTDDRRTNEERRTDVPLRELLDRVVKSFRSDGRSLSDEDYDDLGEMLCDPKADKKLLRCGCTGSCTGGALEGGEA